MNHSVMANTTKESWRHPYDFSSVPFRTARLTGYVKSTCHHKAETFRMMLNWDTEICFLLRKNNIYSVHGTSAHTLISALIVVWREGGFLVIFLSKMLNGHAQRWPRTRYVAPHSSTRASHQRTFTCHFTVFPHPAIQ